MQLNTCLINCLSLLVWGSLHKTNMGTNFLYVLYFCPKRDLNLVLGLSDSVYLILVDALAHSAATVGIHSKYQNPETQKKF